MINFNMIQYKLLKGFENKFRKTYIKSFPYLFVFTLFLVYTMLPVSLDCPFLIVPSVSS